MLCLFVSDRMHIFMVFPLKSTDESLPKGQAGDEGRSSLIDCEHGKTK